MLLASGRLGSLDAFAQLQAATMLATNGTLGSDAPPEGTSGLWVKNPAGKFYEAHDLGNIGLMYLPAAIGAALSHNSSQNNIDSPSIAARFGVAVVVVLWSAVGCLYMVKCFNCFWPTRTSFLLVLAFVTATTFWPYTKSAWDVCGACVGVSVLLYASARILLSDAIPFGVYFTAAAGFLVAVSFRYSTGPFLALPVALVGWNCRRKLNMRYLIIAGLIVCLGMLPTFIYNYVRMGSPLRPATTAEQYSFALELTGSIPRGLFGLFFSPGRGLLIFSPICFLLFTLPFIWSRFPHAGKRLIWMFTLGATMYVTLIAKLPGWNTFGWGPRYLIPVMPIIFLPVAFAIEMLWSKWRVAIVPLIALSVILNGVAVLINWDLATAEYKPAFARPDAYLYPYQQMAVWQGLKLGIEGKPLPGGKPDDDIRKASGRFPDLWEVRLMERSHSGLVAGCVILAILLALVLSLFRHIVCGQEPIQDSRSGRLR